jgi:hypothetical protein
MLTGMTTAEAIAGEYSRRCDSSMRGRGGSRPEVVVHDQVQKLKARLQVEGGSTGQRTPSPVEARRVQSTKIESKERFSQVPTSRMNYNTGRHY